MNPSERARIVAAVAMVAVALLAVPYFIWFQCRIDVPARHMAVLMKKTGTDIPNQDELAPDAQHKGIQPEVLAEGRYFYNPYNWAWQVLPQIEIPQGKLGVRVRLYGENTPPGEVIAWEAGQKGIVPDVLRAGRHAINAWVIGQPMPAGRDFFAEHIELHDPVTVPAGFKGVVTSLSAPMPDDPNQLMVEAGKRGVQETSLDPGTYYVNPYVTRIDLVDCRSQRFNLSESGRMGFPSKDGFFVALDGIIEFRVKPEEAASVFVTYNDATEGEGIHDAIIRKIIVPNARSFCRLRGSNNSGREFISGETRTQFQIDFQQAMADKCGSQGVEVIQALITRIRPPQQIAEPVRERQIALQLEEQYQRQILQQQSEQELAVEKEMVNQKKALVTADQEVVKVVVDAQREQEVALIEANQRLKVAEFQLQAAEDQAAATVAIGTAEAEVIQFDNEAEAAGWRRSVEAFGGEGDEFARWVLLKKIAPAFRSMMVNTADSPLMDLFNTYQDKLQPTAENQ